MTFECASPTDSIAFAKLIDSSSIVYDFGLLWREVQGSCRRLMKWAEDGNTMSTSEAASCIFTSYTFVYHLVSHPCSNYPKGKNMKEPGNVQQMRAVFDKLQEFLENHLCKEVKPALEGRALLEGHEFIKQYICLWRQYLVGVANLKTVFSPLTHTSPAPGFDQNPFEGAEDVAFALWKQHVLSPDHCRRQLRAQFSAIVRTEREPDSAASAVDRALAMEFKDALTILAEPDMYRDIIESDYDSDIEAFYGTANAKGSSTKFGSAALASSPVDYAKECREAIDKETTLAATYLQSKEVVLHRLIGRLVDQYIQKFDPDQISALMRLDDVQSSEDVRDVYNFLALSREKGLPYLEGIVKQFSEDQMKQAVHSDADHSYNRFLCVASSVISRLALFFNSAFVTDEGGMIEAMEAGIAAAFAGFSTKIRFRLVADELASVSNATLTVSSGTPQLTIEDVISMYYFLPESDESPKEHFLSRYQAFLSYRLLSGQYDWELENHALRLLTEVKLSPKLFCYGNMMKDVNEGRIYLVDETDAATGVTVKAGVVSNGTWSLAPSRPPKLPTELNNLVLKSEARCASTQPGRRLTLDPLTSSGIVSFRASSKGGSVIQLRLSLVQMSIVQLFNAPGIVQTRAAIAQETDCAVETCDAALEPLLRARVLQDGLRGLEIGDGSPLEVGRVVSLLPAAPVQSNTTTGSATTGAAPPNLIWHGEKLRTQIMHLLKRTGQHNFTEISQHLAACFPDPPLSRENVKKSLDRLIERGMVARDEALDVFQFVP